MTTTLATEWKEIVEEATAAQMSSVDLAGVLDSICEFLQRYVVFASATQPIVIALWVAHTWTLDSWDCTPYLDISSPEKRSGKTRLLDLLEAARKRSMASHIAERIGAVSEDRERSTHAVVG